MGGESTLLCEFIVDLFSQNYSKFYGWVRPSSGKVALDHDCDDCGFMDKKDCSQTIRVQTTPWGQTATKWLPDCKHKPEHASYQCGNMDMMIVLHRATWQTFLAKNHFLDGSHHGPLLEWSCFDCSLFWCYFALIYQQGVAWKWCNWSGRCRRDAISWRVCVYF